jgi:hypothetical protein
VAQHVERCSTCRKELDQIENEVSQFLALQAPSPVVIPQLELGFRDLLGRIRGWQSAPRETLRPKIQKQVAFQLEMFFGTRTAASVQDMTGEDQANNRVLSVVEPLFSAFLGQKAAALLASGVFEGVDLSDFAGEPAP